MRGLLELLWRFQYLLISSEIYTVICEYIVVVRLDYKRF